MTVTLSGGAAFGFHLLGNQVLCGFGKLAIRVIGRENVVRDGQSLGVIRTQSFRCNFLQLECMAKSGLLAAALAIFALFAALNFDEKECSAHWRPQWCSWAFTSKYSIGGLRQNGFNTSEEFRRELNLRRERCKTTVMRSAIPETRHELKTPRLGPIINGDFGMKLEIRNTNKLAQRIEQYFCILVLILVLAVIFGIAKGALSPAVSEAFSTGNVQLDNLSPAAAAAAS